MKILNLLIFIYALFVGCVSKSDNENVIKNFSLEKVWSSDTLLKTPESNLYDKETGVIYIANMNTGSNEKDGDGFISKMNTNGEIIDLDWVTGLNAPKGMGVYSDKLYVTDITEIVIIDITEAKILEKIPVEGSIFLNDLAIDASGVVYFSDSHDNKIYTYSDGKVEIWVSGMGIDKVNGLYCEKDRVLVAAGDFLAIDYSSKEITHINDSISGADGIGNIGDGYYLVSEWPGEVFIINPDCSIVSLLNTREPRVNTADIDYIQEDSLLIIPTFFSNRIDAYKLISK